MDALSDTKNADIKKPLHLRSDLIGSLKTMAKLVNKGAL